MKFKVLREHYGDRLYTESDEREANERDVEHLVKAGVLQKADAKSEPEPENKAELAPVNKSEPSPTKKSSKRG